MKDIKLMIDFIKEMSCLICGKEVFFYDFDDNKWYSREHSRNVEFEEIIQWLRDNVYPYFYENTPKNLTAPEVVQEYVDIDFLPRKRVKVRSIKMSDIKILGRLKHSFIDDEK